MASLNWPDRKQFAFTVFDDPDGANVEAIKWVYPFIRELGFRTTIGVWPLAPLREPNCPGATCGDADYLAGVLEMQRAGFEVGYHSAAPHSCTRHEVIRSLEVFREHFGNFPITMANHFNADALYWGSARLTGTVRRRVYDVLTRRQNAGRFTGHVEGSQSYWGDIATRRVRYCRNLVFTQTNTLRACPEMPYHDPARPLVPYWYCSTNGPDAPSFIQALSEANQDRLESEGGLCIMYTHFGKGFVQEGRLNSRFKDLMIRLARKQPWNAPTGSVLDFLRQERGELTIEMRRLARLEWRWLAEKLFLGTQ